MVVHKKSPRLKVPVHPIVLGKIGAAYGILGWLRIFSFTEETKDIFSYQPWFIQRSDQWQQLELEDWKSHNKNFIFKIKNIDNRNTANSINNFEIIIDSTQLTALEGNEYYWKDLIGCHVLTTKGYSLGYVQYLIETGSNDVLVIKANQQDGFGIKDRLVPFLDKQVIKTVDLNAKIIKVEWDPSF
ncbi:MAG: ribosome maturation factor RimM [Candidatus Arsenophonus melophagi]|nr:ribosome maturation factor RimM [Candidatus Arsenophonus melophagi]